MNGLCPECATVTVAEDCAECVGHPTKGTDEDPCVHCDNEGRVLVCPDCETVWRADEVD